MKRIALILLGLWWSSLSHAATATDSADNTAGYSRQGTSLCVTCHDVGQHSAVQFMMDSPHGNPHHPGTPMAEKGCESCHGPSAAHTRSPTFVKPGISFGPKWTNSVQQQNAVCESCHKDILNKGWLHGVHHNQDLTCVDCHDLHKTDLVRTDKQAEVCTVCHKRQKTGIHHKPDSLRKIPRCTLCHAPHGNSAPQFTMLKNRSAGCRTCHDLQAMQQNPAVSALAKSYHKAMASPDRTCIDCHRGVAHVALDQIPAATVGVKSSAPVTLFYPGHANFDWINTEHPGAQPFRQGHNCSQCHAGEEVQMGRKLATDNRVSSVNAKLDFKLQNNQLLVTVRWKGTPDDNDVALMLDNGSDEQFTRAGCWATCHNDLPGMERNRGQAITKYLSASLERQRSVGRYAVQFSEATLDKMIAEGHYVELWRVKLGGGKLKEVTSYHILGAREPDLKPIIKATAHYRDGEWTVTFIKPLSGSGKAIVPGKEYTFGVAIHGKGQEKSGHWVSLPMTFGINMRDVDFAIKAH